MKTSTAPMQALDYNHIATLSYAPKVCMYPDSKCE